MDSVNMGSGDKITLEEIQYTQDDIEKLKPANALPTSQKILHEKALEHDLEQRFSDKLHSIPTIAIKRICRNRGHRNVADDALFLENTIDVTRPFGERATMSWMIKQILVNLIRTIYQNELAIEGNSERKFISARYEGDEEVHISPFFKKLGLNVKLNAEEMLRIKSIPGVPIYDSNILVNAIKKNILVTPETKKAWEAYYVYVHYLDREWFTGKQLIDIMGQLGTIKSPQDIKQIVCVKLLERYPEGCYNKYPDQIKHLVKDVSLCEDALLTYLLHITEHVPENITSLFKYHLERLALKKQLRGHYNNLKKGKDTSDKLENVTCLAEINDTVDVAYLKEKLIAEQLTSNPILFNDTAKTVSKIIKKSALNETIKNYATTISYSDIYTGDLIMLFLSETINKHNNVHLETEFYTNFDTKDYYYIPKDTMKKAIGEIKSKLIINNVRFADCGALRPDLRIIMHFMIEQWISLTAYKCKRFLDIWKSHTINKPVSSTLSYKTMDSYKIFSD
jgi:hypothetical protein